MTKNASDVRLSWTDAGAFEYSLYRSSQPSFTGPSELPSSPLAGLLADDPGVLADGQTWYYSVETDPPGVPASPPGSCPFTGFVGDLGGAATGSAVETDR